MLTSIRKLASSEDEKSFGNRMRSRRFRVFEQLTSQLPKPFRIIDVGGTNRFWELNGWADRDDVHIVVVNLEAEPKIHSNIDCCSGDATALTEFSDNSFDVAFSNSTIEHLFTLENQFAMASEIRRVARAYWVQTPNYWFPMEPHFHVPGWQWMPFGLRVALIRRFRCGWRGPCSDREKARQLVREVRLMTRKELARAFPGATIQGEHFMGAVKSWVAVNGFSASSIRALAL
jgi:Methyltransferase domain